MQFLKVGRHKAFYRASAAGAVVAAAVSLVNPGYALGLGADAVFLVYLGMVWRHVPWMTPQYLRDRADQEDPPVWIVFVVALLVFIAAAVSLFLSLNRGEPDWIVVWIGLASVILGWATLNIMAGLHYAYEYYEAPDSGDGDPGARGGAGGLDFPGDDPPDGTAFLYFAFVIGMTAQVSDVEVTSNHMRRLVTAHGVFSFLFNTVLLAAAVNLVITLASGSGR